MEKQPVRKAAPTENAPEPQHTEERVRPSFKRGRGDLQLIGWDNPGKDGKPYVGFVIETSIQNKDTQAYDVRKTWSLSAEKLVLLQEMIKRALDWHATREE